MSSNIFATSADVEVQVEKDTLGGFRTLETGIYPATLKAAYIDRYQSGSIFVATLFEIKSADGTVTTHTENEVVWSANSNGNYYVCKKTGKKKQLIGAAKMDSLAKLLSGKNMEEIEKAGLIENKVHKLYSFDAKKEVPREMPTIMPITGQDLYVAVRQVKENKQVKSGNTYVDTAEIREKNEIEKYFNTDLKTLTEVTNGNDAKHADAWLKANEGKVKDKTKKVAESGMPTAAPSNSTLKLDI